MAGSRLVLPSQQPIQATGLPYAGGQLFFYLTGTSTKTPTYQDSGLTTPNTNPVVLDSAGAAGNVFLDPSIVYKIVLEDASGDLIWTFDPVTPFAPSTLVGLIWGGVSTGTANAQIVSASGFSGQNGQAIEFVAGFTNTGALTLNGGTGAFPVYQPTTTGPALLVGGEVVVDNTYIALWNPNLNSDAGAFQLASAASLAALGLPPVLPSVAPQGRLTLATGVPVMNANVLAATAVLYTPSLAGNQVPVWNGTAFVATAFAETTQLLSDATLSPAAAAVSSVYDMFAWKSGSSIVVTRGPAWTNATTRGYTLTRVAGLLTNTAAITNGPAAGFGVYVGTIATDSAGATITWSKGGVGPGGIAGVLNVWNTYNRVDVNAQSIDNNGPYSYAANVCRQANLSAGNQVSYVSGLPEDSVFCSYKTSFQSTSAVGWSVGLGLDTTAAFNIVVAFFSGISGTFQTTASPSSIVSASIGAHTISANEQANSGVGVNFNEFVLAQINVQFRM